MPVADAKGFLSQYASLFVHEGVPTLEWNDDDNDFGRTVSWNVGLSSSIETIATVELAQTQAQLTITERDLSGDGDPREVETRVIFDALLSFDEQTVSLDGVILPYNDESIRHVIAAFNERA